MYQLKPVLPQRAVFPYGVAGHGRRLGLYEQRRKRGGHDRARHGDPAPLRGYTVASAEVFVVHTEISEGLAWLKSQ